MRFLRQSTAATVIVGPFVSLDDGVTAIASLTYQSTLNGRAVSNGSGAAYTPANSAAWQHDANGFYLAALAAGDVPSVGRLRLEFSDPLTFLPVWEDFTVLSAAVYDELFGSTAPAANVWANGTRTLSAFSFNLTTTVGGYAANQDPATLTWSALTADLSTAGTTGAAVVAIKAQTDQLAFDGSSNVKSNAQALPSPAPDGYGPAAPSGTTAVTDLAGGTGRNPSILTVQNNLGQPIQRASVTAYNAAAYLANPAVAAILGVAVTDAGGHWTLNIPTGEGAVTLVVAASGETTQVVPSAFIV